MKKLLIIALALIMTISFAACPLGGGDDEQPPANDKTPAATPDEDIGLSDKELEDFENALEILEALKPEGWSENNYNMYIYDVWDEDALPDCLPGPIEGMKPSQTSIKDYKHDDLQSDYSVGLIHYNSHEEYRSYNVSFYATNDQLLSYVDALKANGFSGGTSDSLEEDTWIEFHFSTDGWYVYIFFNTNDDDGGAFDGHATVYATDSLHERPKTFAGTPLPQTGAVSYDVMSYFYIESYNYTTDEMGGFDFPLNTNDAFPDSTEQSWWTWLTYYGADHEAAKAYTQQLVNEGWTLTSEYEDYSGDYYSFLEKDGVYASSKCYGGYEHEVGFSDMVENLSY